MGWVRLDDNFADHPKVIALSDSSFRLYIEGLCYANRHLTDGFIPSAVYTKLSRNDDADFLIEAGLWEQVDKGYHIRSYDEYQPTREKIEGKRAEARERLKRYREKQGNAVETQKKRQPQPNPTQPNPSSLDIDISKELVVLPRVKSAKESVSRISQKLSEARSQGINAWNLSKLVEEEWDVLHTTDDVGGCIALTVWYVSELQQRRLESPEISRIGQMTKRFGRLSLMAIDEAAAKNFQGNDLLNYAFRIAQRMYDDSKAKQ